MAKWKLVSEHKWEFVAALPHTAFRTLQFDDGTTVGLDPALTRYDKLAVYAQQAVAARQLSEAWLNSTRRGRPSVRCTSPAKV